MIQLFGQSVDSAVSPAIARAILPGCAGEGGIASQPVEMRASAKRAGGEPEGRNPGARRGLAVHWRSMLEVTAVFAVLAVAYFLVETFLLKAWPVYRAESIVSVQLVAGKGLSNRGAQPGVSSSSDTVEAYTQRQMADVSRQDVLVSAVHRLRGFQQAGESEQAAAQRLAPRLEVRQQGAAYRFSVVARAETPAHAAQIANAVAAASVEGAKRDEQTENAQRRQMWREERDGIYRELAAGLAERDALNKQPGIVSGGAAVAKMERLSELETEISRLKGRVAVVDQEWLDLTLTDGAPATTYQVTAAVAPAGRSKSGVLRNCALIGVAGLFFGALAVVGFVLNRADLKKEDGLLVASDEAIDEHLAARGISATGDAAKHAGVHTAENAEAQNSVATEKPSAGESVSVFPGGSFPVATSAGNADASAASMSWEPSRMWTARRTSTDSANQPVEVDFSAELKRLMSSGKQFSNPWPGPQVPGLPGPDVQGPGLPEAPRVEAKLAPRPEKALEIGTGADVDDRRARLDELRSLLLAIVAKNGSGGNGTTEHRDG